MQTTLANTGTPLASACTPLVSVSLVAYNAEAYIKDAIEGCLMQKTDFPFEILIHDDASQDRTPKIVLDYANMYPDKIVPILQTENQFSKGFEINGKNVIPHAQGKYIAFLEADDYWIDPLKLQKQVDFMEKHPDVSMCFTATKEVETSDTTRVQITRYRNHDSLCTPEDVIIMGGLLVNMASAVVKKTIYDNVPDWYHCTQIWDNSVPLLAMMHGKIQYFNEITAVYRSNVPGSETQNNVKNYAKRKSVTRGIIGLLEGFNEATNHQYDKLINQKSRLISVGMLLLMDQTDEEFKKYYSKLSFPLKVEYHVFNFLGSFRLWERYRQVMRLFRKIKYI